MKRKEKEDRGDIDLTNMEVDPKADEKIKKYSAMEGKIKIKSDDGGLFSANENQYFAFAAQGRIFCSFNKKPVFSNSYHLYIDKTSK